MLALARCLAREARLLLVDELSLGLAPIVVDRLLRAVRAAADGGIGVLLVEQHVHKALAVADRVVVLRRGLVELTGSAAELRDRVDEIQAAYLQPVAQ
jgi:ABC-type branched-subunit amino acid transport system ATPase component